MISNRNFSGVPVDQIPVDDEYRRCNFSRLTADTSGAQPTGVRLFPGDDTPRVFNRCNLTNCEPPPGSTLINCNTHVIEKGVDLEEDVVTVDGVEMYRNTRTKAIEHGRYNGDTELYEYLGVPVEYPE